MRGWTPKMEYEMAYFLRGFPGRFYFLAFAILGWAILLSATGCRSKAALTPQQAEGKQLYDVRCAHCHEYNDLGLKKAPPNLHGVFNHATLPSGLPATDQVVEREVLSGRGLMPPFEGRFTQEQMAALLAYLHTGMR